jgi:acetyl-CoA acetyltransferase
MPEAFICDSVRTPIGRYGGSLSSVRTDDLAAIPIKKLLERNPDLVPGEELTYDYGITLDEAHTPRLKKIWACRCGAPTCTGTMLKPKRRRAAA